MIANGQPRILAVGEEPPPLVAQPKPAPSGNAGKSDKAKRKSSGERFKTFNTFADFTLAQLSRAEIAVWVLLWRDTREGTARTGIADLARRAGCNRSTVFRALRRLERLGLVQVVHRGGLGKGASRYRVRPLTKDC
jgi:predicted transcriptional regulator